jgi:hypothetical protein
MVAAVEHGRAAAGDAVVEVIPADPPKAQTPQ